MPLEIKGGVCSARGFRAAACAAGIKHEGRNDVALLVADRPCAAAAAFTTNKVAAAPVLLGREVAARGKARAILANSGCANACTGPKGLEDARKCAAAVAEALEIPEDEIFVASTGVIGRRLPVRKIVGVLPRARALLGRSRVHSLAAAKAIMTTDTKPKQAVARATVGRSRITVGGMCKGSGMIEPNMATMLGFLTTDADITPAMLKRALGLAIAKSFNRVVVDGDESTNDSVFILASGAARNPKIDRAGPDFDAFLAALCKVCVSLARQMAADGEGATKFVTVRVRGARTDRDAERVARAVARSPLAKTSWFGRDPNWGRVIAAAGYSGADVDESKAQISYNGVWAYRRGEIAGERQLKALARAMRGKELEVLVDLGLGDGEDAIYTCDFSVDYVHINADYTT